MMAISEKDRDHRTGCYLLPLISRPSARAGVPQVQLLRVASVACGIQFGWALQLSLLTPYAQELGIPHAWASVIWLCGPLSGLIVQPVVGHFSDRCRSRFGRRRPFITAGAALIAVAVLIIGHSADIGWLLGDRGGKTRPRAIAAFVLGFWILDVANNMVQGPCRALLADLTGKDHQKTHMANSYFSLFIAVGNILGYAAGSFSSWFKILPFVMTAACDVDCANLKAAFYIDVLVVTTTTYISITAAHEVPLGSLTPSTHLTGGQKGFIRELFGTFRYFPRSVWIYLLVTALTWIGWLLYKLYSTDWMGREIYGGVPNDGKSYSMGVRMGALALTLNSVVLGVTSVFMEKLSRKWGSSLVWGMSNIVMALCFLAMIITSVVANQMGYASHDPPPVSIVVSAVLILTTLGAPLAVTYSLPYALVSTSIESLGLAQGLSLGIMNLAIVIPQMILSVGCGPWDQLFGGGNSPAFAVGALAASIGGFISISSHVSNKSSKSRP